MNKKSPHSKNPIWQENIRCDYCQKRRAICLIGTWGSCKRCLEKRKEKKNVNKF